jgi:glutamate-ammonia-ligase adenylyltransferase
MLPSDLEDVLARADFRDRRAARGRLIELAADGAELLALVQIADELGDALRSSADPDQALNQLGRFVHARGSRLALYHLFKDDPASFQRLIRVLGGSQYLADVLVRNPEYFHVISDSTLLAESRARSDLDDELAKTSEPFPSGAAKLDAVRRYRRREILRIGAGDLCGLIDLRQTTEQLSCLADAVIGQCLAIVAEERFDELIVLGLGKLGGGELNYSSDIDLIFLNKNSSGLEAAARLSRALTAALGEATGEGFLYRVDLRLRPYGGAGAMVVSTDMFALYVANAQPAELQALLKARSVAGAVDDGVALLQRSRPLLLRDATVARGQVRQLKQRIQRQLSSRGEAKGHVKLAPGGIRDIEFLVQALQLEAGGAEPDVITGNTLDALHRLAAARLVTREDADELHEAYVFLRLVEHRLQLMNNQQVHRLPGNAVELQVLARTLGFQGTEVARQLEDAYASHTARVQAIFERVLTGPASAAPDKDLTVDGELLATQLGPSYRQFSPAERQRHADLLAEVGHPGDVQVLAQRQSHLRWSVTVAIWDHLGILSILAGLFAAYGVDIHSGDVFSLRLSDAVRRPPSKRRRGAAGLLRKQPGSARKALDVFVVDVGRWVEPDYWDDFRRELALLNAFLAEGKLDAAREQVMDRVSESIRLAPRQEELLFPVSVAVDNDASPEATEVRIRSKDTPGFLFEFSAALAALQINVHRVEIRTIGHEVQDTFWVTEAQGRKILDQDRIQELRVAAALVKHFAHLLPRAPNPGQALRQFSALSRQLLARPDWIGDFHSLESDEVLRTLADLMGVSEFLWEDFLREQHENLFPVVRDIPALDVAKAKQELREELAVVATSRSPVSERIAGLNQFKDRAMFRIDLRHITRRIDLDQFSRELTDLAEVVIEVVCELCFAQVEEQFGHPRLEVARDCRWCVCGLGKFGGREMGFASDIELIFVYEGEGSTSGPTVIANSRYFEEFVATFLRVLKARREGIFEIDLRLRPHGKAGSLACSLDAFKQYFSPQGAAVQFERLALTKLRVVAGDTRLGKEILQARDQFVYSNQPLNYENILLLRHRQASELVAPGVVSAKHSAGGLTDVEYFVQANQIEVGRSDHAVRCANTKEAIHRLRDSGCWSADFSGRLVETYGFLRQLVEALRVVHGHAKDITLPPRTSHEFSHLARRMEYDSTAGFMEDIERHMSFARSLWGRGNTNLH